LRKTKTYSQTRFDPETLREALSEVKSDPTSELRETRLQQETWQFDTDDEFFAACYSPLNYYHVSKQWEDFALSVIFLEDHADVSVTASKRAAIERVFGIFERNAAKCHIDVSFQEKLPIVFIGHGRSEQWKDLKDHLQDKHGFTIEAYEIGARAGHTIRDILAEMLEKSSFALLVLTGDDVLADGSVHPRLNVMHELGLFQGKLGFSKAIVLLEEGLEEKDFSNIAGIQQLRFSKFKIKETFGDVLATLRREFPGTVMARSRA
jgi:predicted nucleotide-binding protein